MVDRVLFVADQLADDPRSGGVHHPGGAELTDAAAVAACPFKVTLRRLRELELSELERHDVIVLANSGRASRRQLGAIAATRRHVCFEHDVRICEWRGNFPASRDPVHAFFQRCWCPHPALAELYANACGVVFLTRRQERVFLDNPFFEVARRAVLGSSLFSEATLERLAELGRASSGRSGAVYLWAPDRIKGTDVARRHCERMGLGGRAIRDETPERALELMARSRAFVYLPLGLEPAGRMPVEARLAGCEVILNPNVGIAGEPWWRHSRDAALEHLAGAPKRFWHLVESLCSRPAPGSVGIRMTRARRTTALAAALARSSSLALPRLPVVPGVRRRALDVERHPPW